LAKDTGIMKSWMDHRTQFPKLCASRPHRRPLNVCLLFITAEEFLRRDWCLCLHSLSV